MFTIYLLMRFSWCGCPCILTRLPSALFVIDVLKENIAVREANRLGNAVYFSEWLKKDYSDIYKGLVRILNKHNVPFHFV